MAAVAVAAAAVQAPAEAQAAQGLMVVRIVLALTLVAVAAAWALQVVIRAAHWLATAVMEWTYLARRLAAVGAAVTALLPQQGLVALVAVVEAQTIKRQSLLRLAQRTLAVAAVAVPRPIRSVRTAVLVL